MNDSMYVFNYNFPLYNWFYPLTYSEPDEKIKRTIGKNNSDIFKIAGDNPVNRSLYFHIPFCQDICSFCPFTREVLKSAEYLDAYVDALVKEIELKSQYENVVKYPISSIFFGGGTPSILKPQHILKIGNAIKNAFDLSELKEFSFEMNAKTVEIDKIEALKSIGVTHGRMGVQTFNPFYRELFKLSATEEQLYKGAELLNQNFENVCVDMLYGMHGQTIDDFVKDLHAVLKLKTKNIDVYPINNSVVQKRLLQAYEENNLKPTNGLTKHTYNIVLREYMSANGYLPHNGHGYVRSSSDELLKNPVVTDEYVFQYHETNYGYKGHEIIAFGPAGYTVMDSFVVGNTGNIQQYIESLNTKNELQIAGIGQYASWLNDIKGLVLHLPYHGFAEKGKLRGLNINEETKEKIDFLLEKKLIIENDKEYRLTKTGWYNYVNLLYYLSPGSDQEILKNIIAERYSEEPWKINLNFK